MLPVKMRKNNLNGISRTLEDLQLKYCIGSGKKLKKHLKIIFSLLQIQADLQTCPTCCVFLTTKSVSLQRF